MHNHFQDLVRISDKADNAYPLQPSGSTSRHRNSPTCDIRNNLQNIALSEIRLPRKQGLRWESLCRGSSLGSKTCKTLTQGAWAEWSWRPWEVSVNLTGNSRPESAPQSCTRLRQKVQAFGPVINQSPDVSCLGNLRKGVTLGQQLHWLKATTTEGLGCDPPAANTPYTRENECLGPKKRTRWHITAYLHSKNKQPEMWTQFWNKKHWIKKEVGGASGKDPTCQGRRQKSLRFNP